MWLSSLLALALYFVLVPFNSALASPDYNELANNVRNTLERFIRADTTNPPGNESRIVSIVADRLQAAGIPYEIVEFAPGRQNIVARHKGSGP